MNCFYAMLKYFHWAELGTADRIHGKFIQWWVCYISPLIFTSPRHDIRKQMFICLRKRLYPVIIHVFSIQKSFKRRFANFSQLHSLRTLLRHKVIRFLKAPIIYYVCACVPFSCQFHISILCLSCRLAWCVKSVLNVKAISIRRRPWNPRESLSEALV